MLSSLVPFDKFGCSRSLLKNYNSAIMNFFCVQIFENWLFIYLYDKGWSMHTKCVYNDEKTITDNTALYGVYHCIIVDMNHGLVNHNNP